jgi:hypothetical protein
MNLPTVIANLTILAIGPATLEAPITPVLEFERTAYKVSLAMADYEGYNKPGTMAQRYNNPGALLYKGQPGCKRGSAGYAKCKTPEDGWMALHRLIARRLADGLTVRQIVALHAPASHGNETKKYQNFVEERIK